MAQIIIPTPLRKLTDQQANFETSGTTVQKAIEELATQYPKLKNHLLDQDGKIRSFIRIFVEDEDILGLQNEATPLGENQTLSIIPAIAGGAS
ncbi:MAG: MoaD/ThiS family protein [Saprospiraceae bacterium]|nr:MoaD/ThiS family protein [Saprospiraceae bacterium]